MFSLIYSSILPNATIHHCSSNYCSTHHKQLIICVLCHMSPSNHTNAIYTFINAQNGQNTEWCAYNIYIYIYICDTHTHHCIYAIYTVHITHACMSALCVCECVCVCVCVTERLCLCWEWSLSPINACILRSIALVEVVALLVLEAAALWHCVVLSMSVYAHYCVFLAE